MAGALEQIPQLPVAELRNPDQISLQAGLRILEAEEVEEQAAQTTAAALDEVPGYIWQTWL